MNFRYHLEKHFQYQATSSIPGRLVLLFSDQDIPYSPRHIPNVGLRYSHTGILLSKSALKAIVFPVFKQETEN